jgi:predicted GH43/DUF377 family glycosyl hydrolase
MNSVLYNADSLRYEMWFTAGAQISFPYTIGFAKSVDGITWEVYSSNPVLSPEAGKWDAYTVLAPYVIRENGQYKMWYTGCATAQLLYRIGYATSSDGINWARHTSNPVFEPGTANWESASVAYGCIMPYANGYKMWYSGGSSSWSETAIGYATSLDGITWERYTGNPVLLSGTSGQWDHIVFGPRVLYIDNSYYMYYTGEINLYQSDKIGLATSSDGLVWTKYPYNPVLNPSTGQWDGSRIILGSVFMENNTFKMHYSGTNGSSFSIGLATSLFSPPILPGTYTIGTGGNFATIQEAFNKLETDGVAGNVTLELVDDLYTAPTDSFGFKLNGPIPGAGPNSRVTIKPAENKNVVIEGSGYAVLFLINTSYMTFDGVSLTGSTTLTVHAYGNNQFAYNVGLGFVDNSDHNIIQNSIFIHDDILRRSTALGVASLSNTTATPDSNLIQYNFVKKAGIGIYVSAYYSTVTATGNIIRENIIGSETDTLISSGIEVVKNQNSIIEDNVIKGIRGASSDFEIAQGIACWGCLESTIRNNIVHNVNTSYTGGSMGIALLGYGSNVGNGNMVYNNMVYDINSSSSASWSNIGGIHFEYQNNTKVYYNSVYLSGTGANHQGSGAFYIFGPGSSNTELKNNIFVNTRDESPYCASAIYSSANLTSDYNDLYYDDTNQNNCLVRIGSTNYNTLADWQVTTQDLHSYVEMPHFISSTDLHIDETIPTYLESRGIPIAGINTDLDGDQRNADSTDIGADEFDGIYKVTGVENELGIPTEYALEQNYPNPFNPNTMISYQLPIGSDVTIKVYDVLANEISTLVDEYQLVGRYEVEFNASALTSGVYFYQLKAGEFISTKKMVLMK